MSLELCCKNEINKSLGFGSTLVFIFAQWDLAHLWFGGGRCLFQAPKLVIKNHLRDHYDSLLLGGRPMTSLSLFSQSLHEDALGCKNSDFCFYCKTIENEEKKITLT